MKTPLLPGWVARRREGRKGLGKNPPPAIALASSSCSLCDPRYRATASSTTT
ncbi:MAG: hypothetical protein U0802_21250 [Candidatus Binatia bacterium]